MLPRRLLGFLAAVTAVSACSQVESSLAPPSAPNLAKGGVGRPVVLVNPVSNGNGTATTIQEGIDMVAAGGRVMVLPGTYAESLVIDKGLTLEAVGGASGRVVIEPPGRPGAAVTITATSPVSIRDVSVRFGGVFGIDGEGAVDVTIEHDSVIAVDPPLGVGSLIVVRNDASVTGGRARLSVHASALDGSITADRLPPYAGNFGIGAEGDIDALIDGNAIRRTGGACIFFHPLLDLRGEMNVDIVNNDLDECYPGGRVGSIRIGPATPIPAVKPPVTGPGTVNVVGNTIRNSTASCWPATGISYEWFTGRIERNTIQGVVQGCATSGNPNLPAAIWVGSRVNLPPVYPVVRFNDIVGNAQAGLRIGPNEKAAIDATCNWWGSDTGPSGIGPGTGDAVVVQPGAVAPTIVPFAPAPIARTARASC